MLCLLDMETWSQYFFVYLVACLLKETAEMTNMNGNRMNWCDDIIAPLVQLEAVEDNQTQLVSGGFHGNKEIKKLL